MTTELNADIVIFGGGIAGLWLLSRLRQMGYNTLLLEANGLGCGQSISSQGIIHGGTKYTLTGHITGVAQTLASMPGIWYKCLEGKGEIDLSGVKVLSTHQYLWATENLCSRIITFFASKVMRSRVKQVPRKERSEIFNKENFKGNIYQLDEPILDLHSLLEELAKPHMQSIFKIDWPQNVKMEVDEKKNLKRVILSREGGMKLTIQSKRFIFTAGSGNRDLLGAMGLKSPAMQLRPLHMVMMRGNIPHKLYAHCIDVGPTPRLTITTHPAENGDTIWYIGGRIAENGIKRTTEEQVKKAQEELKSLLPWMDFSEMTWSSFLVDRAEPSQIGGIRPNSEFTQQVGNTIVIWPTKLALAPKLVTNVVELLKKDTIEPQESLEETPDCWQHPKVEPMPWEKAEKWIKES